MLHDVTLKSFLTLRVEEFVVNCLFLCCQGGIVMEIANIITF